MKIGNMDIEKDINFEEDVSLNRLSNDFYIVGIRDDADFFPADNIHDTLFGDTAEHVLWNLDTRLDNTVPIPIGKRSSKKSIFTLVDGHEAEKIELGGWEDKPIKEWKKFDTISWIITAGARLGHSFGRMSPDLAQPGNELLNLSKDAFIAYDRDFGGKLFDLLHMKYANEFRGSFGGYETDSEDEASTEMNYSDSSDEKLKIKKEDGKKDDKKRASRGRPPILGKKTKEPRKKLWEFIRDALLDPRYCPRFIRWENYEDKTFRIVDTVKMAELWGSRDDKKDSKMNYEKLSRAVRYYYKKDIFESVPTQRLVYRFGPLATGLETDNPNFDADYYSTQIKSEF